ncbi:MAG: UDP-2,4-diacetamido-2,4,6-trideoxy-beta-L-altropyranose hydrolase [Eubacteriales bacterium]
MIVIRVDGNEKIGTGHMMRCLSIATALREKGEDVRFFVADESMETILQERGFSYKILQGDYTNLEDEITELKQSLSSDTLLLIDSYYVTKKYLEVLSMLARVVYIDDLRKIPYKVDYVINYNGYATDALAYYQKHTNYESLLGTQYAPLREEFRNVTYRIKSVCKRVLLTTGGTDAYNIGGQLLMMSNCGRMKDYFVNIEFVVIVGVFHSYQKELEELAKEYSNITLLYNVKNMGEIMQESDVAISAAGSTIYELCAVGVPTLALSFVENQEEILDTMAYKEAIYSCGHYHKEGVQVLENIINSLKELLEEPEKRRSLSEAARRMVDGTGVSRIADKLIEWDNQK